MGIQEPANAIFILAFGADLPAPAQLLGRHLAPLRGDEDPRPGDGPARAGAARRRAARLPAPNGASARAGAERAGGRPPSRHRGRRLARRERPAAPEVGRVERRGEPGGELAGADRPRRLDPRVARRAGAAARRSVSPQARSFCGSQPPAAATSSSASSVASSAGASSTSSARRVGADQRRPAVALEVAPLRRALVELVVVVDPRRAARPRARRRAAARAARGRRPRGRGRTARASPPSARVERRARSPGRRRRRSRARRSATARSPAASSTAARRRPRPRRCR